MCWQWPRASAAVRISCSDGVQAVGGPDNAFYSLALSDPDAPIPSNPSAREWLHWLVVNAPADNLGSGEVTPAQSRPASHPAVRFLTAKWRCSSCPIER